MQKNEVGLLPHSIYKINLKYQYIKSTNVRRQTKAVEESIGVNLPDSWLDNGFPDLTPKPQEAKGKNR